MSKEYYYLCGNNQLLKEIHLIMIKRVFVTIIMIVAAISMMAQSLDWNSVVYQANNGDVKSMYVYSYYSIYGEEYGIKKNYEGAVTMLQELVVQTPVTDYIIMGYVLLGDCYEKGYGVEKDIDTAKEWWSLAAGYNNADAFAKLTTYQNSYNTTKKTSAKQNSPRESNFTMTINGVSYKMVFVEGSSFYMGSNDYESEGDERPIHKVTLSDYYIGATEVTQELWKAVMGSNPSGFKGSKRPVENVSWYDCQEFIKRLNKLTGKNFRLPTEAEWEFAARGGIRSRGYKYSGSNSISEVAWCLNNSSSTTHPVATKKANELGIYDMSGNAREWCGDWDGEYSSSSQTNPMGPSYGYNRALRGGSWGSNPIYCRVANRDNNSPNLRYNYYGFRLALRP